jgi:Type II secretion system (T2SS), protein M subtype b
MNRARRIPNRQTVVAVGAFFAVLVAACTWGVFFVLANHELQGEFETKTSILEALKQRAVASQPIGGTAVKATLDAAIFAPTETLAASELHRSILATLEGDGGAVHSIQAEAGTDTIGGGLRRLNAQVTFDSSMDSLQKILFHLETTIPFTFVDSIAVQPATPSAGLRNGDLLRVTMSVSSYWKSNEASNGGRDQKDRS